MNKFTNFFKKHLNLSFDKNSIYASPIRRIGSGAIDMFIILIIFNIFVNIAGHYGFDSEIYKQEIITNNEGTQNEELEYVEKLDPEAFSRTRIAALVISAAYFTIFLSSKKQATIGNQIFKIMVVNIKNPTGRISPLVAFIRYILFLLNNNIFGLGYLLYFFTKDHCFLQDYLSDTRIINIK